MEVTVRIRRNSAPGEGSRPTVGSWRLWSALLAALLLLAASFAARPRSAPAAPSAGSAVLAVTSASLQQSPGLAVVEGRVKNLSGATLENVWIRAEFLGARGEPAGWSQASLLEPARLEPLATAEFRLFGAPEREIAFARLEFSQLVRRPLAARHETVEALPVARPRAGAAAPTAR